MSNADSNPETPPPRQRRAVALGFVTGCAAWSIGLALLKFGQQYAAVGLLVVANVAALAIGASDDDHSKGRRFFSGFLMLEAILIGLYMLLQPLCVGR